MAGPLGSEVHDAMAGPVGDEADDEMPGLFGGEVEEDPSIGLVEAIEELNSEQDEMPGPFGGEVEVDRLIGLVQAIEQLESEEDEHRLASGLTRLSLSRDDIVRLARMKVPGVNGGKLTVLGHLCVKKSCSQALLRLLFTKENFDSSEEFDGHRIPLLNLAAYCGNKEAVDLMCPRDTPSAGANILATGSTGLNALHMAVKSRETEVITMLSDYAWQRSKSEFFNLVRAQDDLGMTPLHYAAWEGDKDVTQNLISDFGDMISLFDIERNGLIALHLASLNNGIGALHVLLKYHASDVNITNKNGLTALHMASWNNHSECVLMLLHHPYIDMNARDMGGLTASYLASRNHIGAMCKILLRLIPNHDIVLNDATDEDSFIVEYLSLWKQQKRIIEEMFVRSQDAFVSLPQISQSFGGSYLHLGKSMRESLRSDFKNLESPLFQFSPDRERWLETMENNWQGRAETNEFLTPDFPIDLHGYERPGPGREVVIDDLADKQLLTVLGKVIIRALNQGVDEVRVIDRLKLFSDNDWLSDQDIMRLGRARFRDNEGGESDQDIMRLHRPRFRDNDAMLSVLGHLCVRQSDSAEVLEFLVREANVNILEELDNHSIPLLHLAAYCRNDAALQVLCNVKGIDFSARCSSNQNVLHMAVKGGLTLEYMFSPNMVSDLVNGKDDMGMTPLHYVAWEGDSCDLSRMCNVVDVNATTSTGLTPLHLASWNNSSFLIYWIFKNYGATINMNIADHNGFTALHLASWNNGFKSVRILVNQGADKRLTDKHGLTALYLASRNHIEVVCRLLHHPDVNLNETHDRSFIALYLSSWKRNKKKIEEILSSRENDQSSSRGCTHNDVTSERMFVGHTTLGESSRKSLADDLERMESHLFQFSSRRERWVSTMKNRVWNTDIQIQSSVMDWQKGPAEEVVARGNLADEQLLIDLMEAILALKPGADEAPVVDRLVWFSENNWLSKDDIRTLSRMRVPGVSGGRLSVLGHLCMKQPCSQLVLRFLLRRADGNILEKFEEHSIPLLHLAGYYRNYEAVNALTDDRNINLLARSSSKLNALHVAVKNRDTRLAQSIYDAVLRARESDAWLVALKRDLASVSESMPISELVNGQDEFGMTPLHYAVWEDDESMIDLLLSMKKIKVNAVDNDGLTPLHLASWNKQGEALKKLLKSPYIETSLPSGETMSKAFDWQSKRECLEEDTFKKVESHLRQFVFDERILEEMNSKEMRDDLQENDGGEGRALDRELRGDENRGKTAKHLWPSRNNHVSNGKMTALHCAAWLGHSTIVAELMERISKRPRARTMANLVDKYGFSPIHYAVLRGDAGMVDELLSHQMVKGNIREQSLDALTPLRMAYLLVKHFDGQGDEKETVEEYKLIIGFLEEHSDVKAYIESLYKERQLFIDAANAILVGAALIASISFAGWLQPPLGYQQYYESRYLLTGSAPPDTYASFASVKQHISVTMFWVFNSLSFFFAVGTVVAGACVVLPMREKSELEEHVDRMRRLHIWTTLFLCLSVVFVLGAFIAAGFASLPTELEYQWVMILTTGVGGSVTIFALFYYLRRVFILVKWIWGRHTARGLAKGRSVEQFFLSLFVRLCIKAHLLTLSWGNLLGL